VSARVLVTCWPFTGHVFGQLGIAEALRARGHDVAFYTGESARSTIEDAGFEVFGFRHVDEGRAFDNVRSLESRDQRRLPNPRQLARAFDDWLVATIPDQMADLEPLLDRWQPDVLATDLSLWAPIVILHEKAPVPIALSSTFMGPLIPGRDAPPWGLGLPPPRTRATRAASALATRAIELAGAPLRRRVDALRAVHGLPPMGCSVNAYTARLPLYLVGSLRELDHDRHDLADSVHYVGECTWHPPDPPGTTEWLDGLAPERPLVHVTEGTLHTGDPFILRAAVAGLAGAPVEAVLTTGGHRSPGQLDLGPAASNVHVRQWISHAELLPRCAAVVTAGGQATILSALKAGVPLVVVPTTWDKPDNARRVVEAGVGVRVRPRRLTPARLRAAVETVLHEPRYRAAAERVSALLAAAPGPPRAAELLETLAAARAVAG
jgi:MGT family glycosyltransferase